MVFVRNKGFRTNRLKQGGLLRNHRYRNFTEKLERKTVVSATLSRESRMRELVMVFKRNYLFVIHILRLSNTRS